MYCIYRITNLINRHTYIGQHKYKVLHDNYFGSGLILKKAIKKYGWANFIIDYLVTKIPDRSHADIEEKKYIALEKLKGKAEYNILNGGQGFTGHHTEESRKKIGLASVGNKYALHKNLGNKYALGNVLSEETRKRMGESRKGNTNNGCKYIECLETGEIRRVREWILLGYRNVYTTAKHNQKTCKGLHFEYVTAIERVEL